MDWAAAVADRVGKAKVLIGGHVALLAVYLTAGGPISGAAFTIVSLLLLGTFYAATDGVLPALVSRLVPEEARGSGIAAFVSIYPACWMANQAPALSAPHEIVNTDIRRPTLVLLGGRDTETPPSDCLPRLRAAKAAGAPVQWHLYPNAGHCWDCPQWDGTSRIDFKGDRVEYRFDEAVTRDSIRPRKGGASASAGSGWPEPRKWSGPTTAKPIVSWWLSPIRSWRSPSGATRNRPVCVATSTPFT